MNMKVSVDKNSLAILVNLAENSLKTIKQDGLDVPPDLIVAITEIRRLLERPAREQQETKISRGNSNECPKFDPRQWAIPLNRPKKKL
jgi:hypothetical protein